MKQTGIVIRELKGEHGEREWCAIEVRLTGEPEKPRLSICGSAGYILTKKQAKREAREYWESYFEEDRNGRNIRDLNERCGTNFRSARSAARYVLNTDGEFSGLDLYPADGKGCYVTTSCGQIRDELTRFFPDMAQYFKWHLNDMRSECEHQESRGEKYESGKVQICPDCGYRLGSAWTYRALPADVIEWAKNPGKPAPARLDSDGTAKGKTEIRGSFRAGDCVGPQSPANGYTIHHKS